MKRLQLTKSMILYYATRILQRPLKFSLGLKLQALFPFATAASTNFSMFLLKASSQRMRSECMINKHNSRKFSVNSSKMFEIESDFPIEVQHALQATRKACDVTRKVQKTEISSDDVQESSQSITQTKQDDKPVTIADYAAQAIILNEMHNKLPNDLFLAEESCTNLLDEKDHDRMIRRIKELTGLVEDDNENNPSKLLNAIDIGQGYHIHRESNPGPNLSLPPPDRFWCLDPIDGTKGFLRNGQYCVAMALLEKGKPTIGILACPNLPSGNTQIDNMSKDKNGCIFVACKGKGCYEIGMRPSSYINRLGYSNRSAIYEDPTIARFCVAVEQGFNDPDRTTIAMGKILHGSLGNQGDIEHCTRMDSQVKYGVIARGDAEFYVRLPRNHKDNIWDVAAGVLCLEEVGGKVTDTLGQPLDFTQGSKLPTVGILGARTEKLHDSLIEAYRKATRD